MPMENNLTLKTYMAIMAERDAAIRERNMALDERKRLFAERDMAMLQRDAALAERNSAIEERDKALAALHLREDSLSDNANTNTNNNNNNNLSHDESKHIYQQMHDVPWLSEPAYHPTLEDSIHVMSETVPKPKKGKQKKETTTGSSRKLPKPVSGKAVKREDEIQDWTNELNFGSEDDDDDEDVDDDEDEERSALWRENSGLNQITYDETVMPVPVCSCSGVAHPCYKWGNGGWQSACCSSGYGLSGGKRQTGRKMSGNAFTQLLNQVASEGYDLSTPIDLTNYWEN